MAPGGWPSRHATDEAAGDERIQFAFAGQISEMPARGTVRLEDAIDACVHLVQTGSVTEKLKWQDD